MLGELVDLFATGGVANIFGAVSGLIGGWLAKREQRKLLELENSHERYMADVDLKRDQLQYDQALAIMDKKVEQAQVEGQIQDDIRTADAFVASHKPNPFNKIGNAIKSAVRPIITGILLWVTWQIYTETSALVGGLKGLDTVKLQELFVYIVHAIIFLTITAVSWWFASRGERAVKAIKGMMNG